MNTNALNEFREHCYYRHDIAINQKYDNKYPYSLHLNAVEQQVKKFKHLISSDQLIFARAGAMGHDLIVIHIFEFI